MSLGLRSTKIRSKDGEVYFIPNGTINQVVNYSLMYNLALVELPIRLMSLLKKLKRELIKLLAMLITLKNIMIYYIKMINYTSII